MKYSIVVFLLGSLFSINSLATENSLRVISSIPEINQQVSHLSNKELNSNSTSMEYVESSELAMETTKVLSDEELENYLFED